MINAMGEEGWRPLDLAILTQMEFEVLDLLLTVSLKLKRPEDHEMEE